jgi:FlaA1/EpsC-like NDP-sugar epimerase
VRIVDIARRLIAESHTKVDIVFTGLRPGEKLHEVLFSEAEDRSISTHPLISRVAVPVLDPSQMLDGETERADDGTSRLRRLAGVGGHRRGS